MDNSEGDIAALKGKTIQIFKSFKSVVPGKIRVGGQCLAEDTLVQTSSGDIVNIKDLQSDVQSIDLSNLIIGNTTTTDKWTVQKDKFFRIITKSPRNEIIASSDHIFFVREDQIREKSASELKKGDHLLMPEKIDVKGKIHGIDITDCHEYKILKTGRKLIEEKRKAQGLFQRELAERIKVHQVAISALELGKVDFIRFAKLKTLCKELKIDLGDFIRMHTKSVSTIRLPKKIDKVFAQIIGYYIGDGSLDEARISFAEQREDLAKYYLKKITSFFNANGSIKFRENKKYYQIRISGRPIEKLFRKFPKKQGVPKEILRSPNRVVAGFLRGFFDAEGYVSNRVALGINDKKLAKQVQLLLLRFGILSSVQRYDNRRNPYSNMIRHTVELCGKDSTSLFKKYIGFSAKDKQTKLSNLIDRKSDTNYARQILLLGSEVRKIIERHGFKIHQLFGAVAPSGFFVNQREMSKPVFKRQILNKIKDYPTLYAELEKIYKYPIIPIKIHRIERVRKPVKMVDISTKAGNFIANGLVVHNSAARFARVREGLAMDFYKKLADKAGEIFKQIKNMQGILIGGPGPTKNEFIKVFPVELKTKIIGIQDIGYTGEHGLQELVAKSQDIL